MTTFLLDIWQDLREKRLWPIAVALVAATIAAPVVLVKPAAGPPTDNSPQGATPVALPTVSPDEAIVDSSNLDTFDIKDPFNSQADHTASGLPGGSGAQTASVPGGASTSTGTGGGASTGGSSSGSGSTGSAGGSGGGTGGGTPSSGGGTRYFTYTVDVHFGPRSSFKPFKGVQQLDLLPDDQNPIVSFMGMKDNATVAVFFIVDPAFKADGEGDCAPSEADCRFIYLKVDDSSDEETLSAADGNLEYQLKLDTIHIKHLTAADAVGDAKPDTSSPQVKSSQLRHQDNLLTITPLALHR